MPRKGFIICAPEFFDIPKAEDILNSVFEDGYEKVPEERHYGTVLRCTGISKYFDNVSDSMAIPQYSFRSKIEKGMIKITDLIKS